MEVTDIARVLDINLDNRNSSQFENNYWFSIRISANNAVDLLVVLLPRTAKLNGGIEQLSLGMLLT